MYCLGNNQSRVAVVLGYVHTIPIAFRGVTKGYRHSMNGNAGPGRHKSFTDTSNILGPFIRGKIRRELYHLYEHVLPNKTPLS